MKLNWPHIKNLKVVLWSPFLDVSLVATTVAVASKLSLDLEIGLEACTILSEFTLCTIEGPSLFGSSKASLQPGVVSALSVETNEAILSRLSFQHKWPLFEKQRN